MNQQEGGQDIGHVARIIIRDSQDEARTLVRAKSNSGPPYCRCIAGTDAHATVVSRKQERLCWERQTALKNAHCKLALPGNAGRMPALVSYSWCGEATWVHNRGLQAALPPAVGVPSGSPVGGVLTLPPAPRGLKPALPLMSAALEPPLPYFQFPHPCSLSPLASSLVP